MNIENIKGNEIKDLEKRFETCKDELNGIEKFITEQLQDLDDEEREFRFNMFARHFREVFVLTNLFFNIENAIKAKKREELNILVIEFERQMNFFRMFKNKKWEPQT